MLRISRLYYSSSSILHSSSRATLLINTSPSSVVTSSSSTTSMSRVLLSSSSSSSILTPQRRRSIFTTSLASRKKKKGSKKGGGGDKSNADHSDEAEVKESFDLEKAKSLFTDISNQLKKRLSDEIKATRDPILLISSITVQLSSGGTFSLSDLCSISTSSKSSIILTVLDGEHVRPIESALLAFTKLSLSPITEGVTISIQKPKLSEEIRDEWKKKTEDLTEHTRVKLRQQRQKTLKEAKQKAQSKEEEKALLKTVTKMIDDTSNEIDLLAKKKIKEINDL